MTKNVLSRGIYLVAALAFTACPTSNKCVTNADCKTAGQVCSVMSGTCVTDTGSGGGTGGGTTGGGTGGGTTGGGTGGGTTGGGNGGGGGTVVTSNGGETCDLATLITAGLVKGDTTGKMNDYEPPPSCSGFTNPGPDTTYKIMVPAGQRLTVRVTPDAPTATTDQFDPSVYLLLGPASNCSTTATDGGSGIVCLSGSDDPQVFEAVEGGSWLNTGTTDVEVIIVIDSGWDMGQPNADGGTTGGFANEGKFTLEARLGTPVAGDRCESAVTLTSGTTLMNQDLGGFGNDYLRGPSCKGSVSADMAYKVVALPAGQVLTVVVTPSAALDAVLNLSTSAASCGAACDTAVNAGAAGEAETLVHKNTSGADETVFLVVDGEGATTGTFSIVGTITAPPGDDTCNTPTPLTSGQAIAGHSFVNYTDDFNDLGTATGCGFQAGPDRVYSITVNNGDQVVIDVTPTAASAADPIINLVDGAGACGTACLANVDNGFEGEPEQLRYVNRSGAAQTYLVVVDSWFPATPADTFDVKATVSTPPPDDVCTGATALNAGAPLAGTTVNYSGDYGLGTGCATAGYAGADRAYAVRVPPFLRGSVTIAPLNTDGGTFAPSVSLVEGPAANCAVMPRVCAASVAGAVTTRTVSYFNQGDAGVDLFAIVDSASATGGDYTLTYATATPAVDDLCTTATTTLTVGTPVTANLTGFSFDYGTGSGCASNGGGGADRVYKITVQPSQALTLTATPTDTSTTAGPTLGLNVIKSTAAVCDSSARACVAGANATGRGLVATTTYINTSTLAEQLLVIVSDTVAGTANTGFTLATTSAAIPATEVCQSATPITASGTVAAINWTGFSRQYVLTSATMCASYPGADRVYSVTLNAGQTLTASTLRDTGSTADAALNLIEGPATNCASGATCLASDDAIGATADTVTYTNATAAMKTIYIVIGSWAAGNFTLTVQLQ